jgi:hypothetical protein
MPPTKGNMLKYLKADMKMYIEGSQSLQQQNTLLHKAEGKTP